MSQQLERGCLQVISTSNCGNPALRLFGFGPVDRDGFGVGSRPSRRAAPCELARQRPGARARARALGGDAAGSLGRRYLIKEDNVQFCATSRCPLRARRRRCRRRRRRRAHTRAACESGVGSGALLMCRCR